MTEYFRNDLQKSLGDAGDINYLQGYLPASQQHAANGDRTVNLPILQIGVRAENGDRTAIPQSWNLVNIYENSRDGVVKIVGQREGVDATGRRTVETVTGSGFFVTEDGRIATDYHVVQGLRGIQIQTADGRTYSARVENVETDIDKANDLAVIKVTNASPFQRFKALPLGDPNLKLEDGVVAIGYPRGWQDMYVSPGIYKKNQPLSRVVSASSLGDGENGERIVMDASINVQPGNSGGPLLSKDGRVIGIIATTDAKPDPNDETRSVPGRSAESTPVQDLLVLLNRSRQYTPTDPIRTAGSLRIDTAPPYYPAPPPAPSGLGLGSGGGTNFRRALIGMPGYGSYTRPSESLSSPSDAPFATPALPSFRPQPSRGFFGTLQLNQNRSSSSGDSNVGNVPAGGDPNAIVGALPTGGDISDLQRPAPPRPMHPIAHGVNVYNQFTMLRAGRPGVVGPILSGTLGVFDLATEDFGNFRQALSNGSGSDVFWSGVKVGADLMLIGGGIAGFNSRYRAIGSVASIGGSLIKMGADGNSYYNHFRK